MENVSKVGNVVLFISYSATSMQRFNEKNTLYFGKFLKCEFLKTTRIKFFKQKKCF